jgi:hypothetical protein
MCDEPNAVPKVHPASREILPDDPLELHAVEIPGDPALMLRLLVEEYARIGCDVEDVVCLARDPNYVAFYGLWKLYGEQEFRRRVAEIRARCGVLRLKAVETVPLSERLVQIELPA